MVTPPPGFVLGTDDVLGIVFWREPDLSGDVTVERLYRYIKQHFEAHAEQIRKKLGGILV